MKVFTIFFYVSQPCEITHFSYDEKSVALYVNKIVKLRFDDIFNFFFHYLRSLFLFMIFELG